MVAVWVPVTAGAERRPPGLIVPMFVLQVAWEVTLVVVALLQVAVAVYCDVVLSFTDAAPLIAMLLSVIAGAATVMVMAGALTSPWVEPVLFVFPNQAAA